MKDEIVDGLTDLPDDEVALLGEADGVLDRVVESVCQEEAVIEVGAEGCCKS